MSHLRAAYTPTPVPTSTTRYTVTLAKTAAEPLNRTSWETQAGAVDFARRMRAEGRTVTVTSVTTTVCPILLD